MSLGYFAMPLHPPSSDPARTTRQQTILNLWQTWRVGRV
jgi:hypothetical protein